MANEVITQTSTPSALTKFTIGYEYDLTWAQVHKQLKK